MPTSAQEWSILCDAVLILADTVNISVSQTK